jgi:hypothetical protein
MEPLRVKQMMGLMIVEETRPVRQAVEWTLAAVQQAVERVEQSRPAARARPRRLARAGMALGVEGLRVWGPGAARRVQVWDVRAQEGAGRSPR